MIVRLMRIDSSPVGPPLLDRLEQQLPFRRAAEHDESPIGLQENLEQAVQQLRQHAVDGQRFPQVLRDLDQRPQLHLRVHAEPHTGRVGRDIELRHDRRAADGFGYRRR